MAANTVKQNERIRHYARQMSINSAGQFKNSTTKNALIAKLTPAQQRRLRKKG